MQYQKLAIKSFTWPEQQRLLKAAQRGERDAETQLLLSYVPMILRITHRWAYSEEEFDEMVHVGMIETVQAIRKFDFARKNRLSTVISQYVRIGFIRFKQRRTVIRIPQHAFEERAEADSVQLREVALATASIESTLADGKTLGHSLVDVTAPDPIDIVMETEAAELLYVRRLSVQRAIDCLDDRRQRVLRGRMAGQTLIEVSQSIGGVSKERVRQLEASALRDLEKILRRMGVRAAG